MSTAPKSPRPDETAKASAPAKESDAAAKTPSVAQRSERALAVSVVKDPCGERVAQARSAPTRTTAAERPSRTTASGDGDYFVQVGAFKDQSNATRLAASLRAQNYPVAESVTRVGGSTAAGAPRPAPRTPAPAPAGAADRYDVIVTGGSPGDINTRLAAKGLAAEPAADGVRIRPSLPLRDAVALSKDLNNDGFKVQVRRGGTTIAPAAPPVKAPTMNDGDGGGEMLYRVRVGGFPDRATAQSVLRALKGKGYDPFIAKGRE